MLFAFAGVSKMLSDGYYDSAYPLHEVKNPFSSKFHQVALSNHWSLRVCVCLSIQNWDFVWQ